MNNSHCCVLPEKRKAEENIIRVELNHRSYADFQCQFEGELPAIYPYEGKNFCILHLPWPTPEEKQQGQKTFEYEKKKAFADMLQAGETRFRYISATDLKIKSMDLKDKYLSFPGSWIWTLRIRNIKEIDTLDLSDTRLRGVNEISIGQINSLYIKN